MNFSSLNDALHSITQSLGVPAIIILIILIILVLFELGGIITEYFVERIKKKPDVTRVLEEITGKNNEEMVKIIKANPFQLKQKQVFFRFLKNGDMNTEEQRLLATQLLSDEEARVLKRVVLTDVIARIGPMFGLLGTLIPLGPGLIALGQGDTHGLASSLLTAFDTTIAGLATSAAAFVMSRVRKFWYQKDIATVETILEGLIR